MEHEEPRYALARAAHDAERRRLEKLQAIHDPATLARLDAIGVAPGARCLEVGAGAGSIARALAERVGAAGEVVAADLDPRFLADFAGPSRRVLRHDITFGPVPPGDFDLVHARAVLAHVEDLPGAVAHLVESVRPGGVLLCEEPDYGVFEACDPDHPRTPVFREYVRGIMAGERMDPRAGRHVFAALRATGLEELRSNASTEVVCGGSLRARYRRETMENVRQAALTAGAYDAASFEALLACFDDPSFAYLDALFVGVWGRRPA